MQIRLFDKLESLLVTESKRQEKHQSNSCYTLQLTAKKNPKKPCKYDNFDKLESLVVTVI